MSLGSLASGGKGAVSKDAAPSLSGHRYLVTEGL
jgi:hypothetical protein